MGFRSSRWLRVSWLFTRYGSDDSPEFVFFQTKSGFSEEFLGVLDLSEHIPFIS